MDNFTKINIITKEDLIYLLDDINQAQEAIYQEDKKITGKQLRDFLKEQEFEKLDSRERQEEFLTELKENLQNIPQVKITVAFAPSDGFLKETSQWLEDEIGEKVIIDLTVNHKIVAGAVIEYQGRYLNLALNKKIEQITSHE